VPEDQEPAASGGWRAQLAAAGLLVPAGADGIYARSAEFERLVTAVQRLVEEAAAGEGATVVRFPPVVPVAVLEGSGYLSSFPGLTGTVHSFGGDDRDHRRLLRRLEEGGDWSDALVPTGTALCSAVCHPLYPTLTGVVPPGGSRWDVYGWVFRHEPATDPARMQAFRQYDIVYVGDRAGAVEHRDRWRARALEMALHLGLEAECQVANDPFFGRMGQLLAANQRHQELKFEILAPAGAGPEPTAISSSNWHQDHFGTAFAIRTPDGATAHSACVGFGVERWVLALLHAYGLQAEHWPESVRHELRL
jgi:seryl-tRNA synthetase